MLGSLGEHERRRYRAHLQHCEACAAEVDLLCDVTIGHDVSTRPSAVALAGVNATDGLALSESLAGQGTGGGGGQRAATKTYKPARYMGHGIWDDRQVEVRTSPVARKGTDGRKGKRRLFQPVSKPVLGITLAVLVFAVITVYMSHTAASVSFVRGQTAWKDAGIALQIKGSSAELLTEGLPAAPTGDQYEVWLLGKDRKTLIAAGLGVTPNSSGQAGVNLPGKIGDSAAVLVYAEPVGAHASPTVADHPVAIVYVDGKRIKG